MRAAPRAAAAAVLVALATGGCAGPAPHASPVPHGSSSPGAVRVEAEERRVEVEFDGIDREYLLTVPEADAGGGLPLLIALHGARGSAAGFSLATGLPAEARRADFVLAVPDGVGPDEASRTWNAGTCCGLSVGEVDDVAFLERIIDDISHRLPIDPRRVFVAGFSNGGMMAYRMGCESGGRIAGMAVVAGALNVEECPAPERVPLLAVHGAEDAVVPYEGGQPLATPDPRIRPWVNASVAESVGFWVDRNGCGEPSDSAAGSAVRTSWAGCEVELITVPGGGHTWFGAPGSRDRGLEPEGAPSATAEVLRFFGLG